MDASCDGGRDLKLADVRGGGLFHMYVYDCVNEAPHNSLIDIAGRLIMVCPRSIPLPRTRDKGVAIESYVERNVICPKELLKRALPIVIFFVFVGSRTNGDAQRQAQKFGS